MANSVAPTIHPIEREIVQVMRVWDLKRLKLLDSLINPSRLLCNLIGINNHHNIQKESGNHQGLPHTNRKPYYNHYDNRQHHFNGGRPTYQGYPQNRGNSNSGHQGTNYQTRGNQQGGAPYHRTVIHKDTNIGHHKEEDHRNIEVHHRGNTINIEDHEGEVQYYSPKTTET